MNTIVSIIVPFYHPPKLMMRKCIESLKEQTFSNFEVLLIDDGNEEDYQAFVESCVKNDERFKYVKKAHAGVSAARNLGIELATGKYISFIDADDFVDEAFLTKMLKHTKGCELTICGIDEQWYPVIPRVENKRLFFSQPTFYNGVQYINFCANKLFCLDIIKEHKIFFDEDVKLGEDALFLNKYFKYCNNIRIITDRLYHYVPSNNSAVRKYQPDYWAWEKQVIECQWEMFHTYPLIKNQELAMVHWLYCKFRGTINYYLYSGDDKTAIDKIIQEIVSHPLFQEFKKYDWTKKTPHFSNKNRIVLYLWSKFDLKGVYFAKKIEKYLNKVKG